MKKNHKIALYYMSTFKNNEIMKHFILFLALGLFVVSCKETKDQKEEIISEVETGEEMASNYQKFGAHITDENVLSKEEMIAAYKNLKAGDTIDVKFTSKVKSVCQSKGCWMRLDMDDAESFVKFKDYGFFMPKDIAGQEVIVSGKAFVENTSVEDLKHFAKDAGKSEEEIAEITTPELSYSFLSSGVLIPEQN